MITATDKLFKDIVDDVDTKIKSWCGTTIESINNGIPEMDPTQLSSEIASKTEYAQNTLLIVHEVHNLMKVLKYVSEKLPNSQDCRSLIVAHLDQINDALVGEYDQETWDTLLESTKTLSRLFGNMVGLNEYK